MSRFTRAHRTILKRCSSTDHSDSEWELSYSYFVPAFLARIILHKLQIYSVLHELDGLVVCGICRQRKFLVIDHEHHGTDHNLSHLRDFLCHTCNRRVMSIVDRLGNDKGYITVAGALTGEVDQAVTSLVKYIQTNLRDTRLVSLQDDFDRCAAELFGNEYKSLIGASYEMRSGISLRGMVNKLTPFQHRQLVRRFRSKHRQYLDSLHSEGALCFLTGRASAMGRDGRSQRMLSIDHCHRTLLLRGLILGWFNLSLESILHNPGGLQRAWRRSGSNGKLGKALHLLAQDNPFLVTMANLEAARIGSQQWKPENFGNISRELARSLDGDSIKIDCLKMATILDRQPVHDPQFCNILTKASEERRIQLRSKKSRKRKFESYECKGTQAGGFSDLDQVDFSDYDMEGIEWMEDTE
ncbi:hypothetical protein GQ53DRAFT_756600 [Thozetella sp. PMI_491]|nr:hypothetical protein GQ53DRAFT_756600 [Thozetella sp. PMI_491]